MKRMTLWIGCTLTLFTLVLFAACSSDEGTNPTGSSSLESDWSLGSPSATGPASSHQSKDNNSKDNNSKDDKSKDDKSKDGKSKDNSSDNSSSSDDSSSDDSSSDDNSSEEKSKIRGLFFGVEDCPDPSCSLALRIGDTLVWVSEVTRIDNQPAHMKRIGTSELMLLLQGNEGLPMRAKGTFQNGILMASRVRIEKKIRVTGEVIDSLLGCELSLKVNEIVTLCFILTRPTTGPGVGEIVRVHGKVPAILTPPPVIYEAKKVRMEN